MTQGIMAMGISLQLCVLDTLIVFILSLDCSTYMTRFAFWETRRRVTVPSQLEMLDMSSLYIPPFRSFLFTVYSGFEANKLLPHCESRNSCRHLFPLTPCGLTIACKRRSLQRALPEAHRAGAIRDPKKLADDEYYLGLFVSFSLRSSGSQCQPAHKCAGTACRATQSSL